MQKNAQAAGKTAFTSTRTIGGLLGVLLLSACATNAPEYQRPEASVPTEFRGAAADAGAASIADQPWETVFADPALQALIREGLDHNLDLQIAAARIEQARAMVGVVNSQAKPQLNYRTGAGGEKAFVPDSAGSPDSVTYASVGGALEAAWELDVWGRIRHATDAAQANLMAQEDIRRGVVLTLISDIATGYFRLLELDRELAIAQESASVYGQMRDLFAARFNAGRDSRLPVERTQALLEASDAKVATLRRAIGQQENALSLLTGSNPRAISRGQPLTAQAMPPTPLGATTALLQRRPDILAAEQSMIRANAQMGEALAERFPRVGLGSLLGGIAADAGDGWDTFGVWNLALAASGPLYDGGRLKSVYEQRKAFWDETVADYRKTVLVAFRETSDSLTAQQNLADGRKALEAQIASLRRSSDLALDRYKAGRASYFEVLEAQQQLFPAEDALAQTVRDQLIANVGIYKALGGGWTPPPAEPPAVQVQAEGSKAG